MREFKKGSKNILIATDVAARGIDIEGVDLIIQLSPP
jgi:superfamily II DNA/RNA helicase